MIIAQTDSNMQKHFYLTRKIIKKYEEKHYMIPFVCVLTQTLLINVYFKKINFL